jgi:hypothetical protein
LDLRHRHCPPVPNMVKQNCKTHNSRLVHVTLDTKLLTP